MSTLASCRPVNHSTRWMLEPPRAVTVGRMNGVGGGLQGCPRWASRPRRGRRGCRARTARRIAATASAAKAGGPSCAAGCVRPTQRPSPVCRQRLSREGWRNVSFQLHHRGAQLHEVHCPDRRRSPHHRRVSPGWRRPPRRGIRCGQCRPKLQQMHDLTRVTPVLRIGSVQENRAKPAASRKASIRDRSSVKWTALTSVTPDWIGSSVKDPAARTAAASRRRPSRGTSRRSRASSPAAPGRAPTGRRSTSPCRSACRAAGDVQGHSSQTGGLRARIRAPAGAPYDRRQKPRNLGTDGSESMSDESGRGDQSLWCSSHVSPSSETRTWKLLRSDPN